MVYAVASLEVALTLETSSNYMSVSPREVGAMCGACVASVLSLPCVPKLVNESLFCQCKWKLRWNLSGVCGLVAGAPGARQAPGRFQPVGYVGQAHLHTHV